MRIPTDCEEEECSWSHTMEKEGSRTRPREELTSETVSIEALDNTVRSFEAGVIL